jgi:hypothetical protein
MLIGQMNHFILPLLLLSHISIAQFNETIRTGRPGQAIGPYGVGKYVFQSQTGVDFGGSDNTFDKSSSIVPNTLLRFGISKHIDLNTGVAYRKDVYEFKSISKSSHGLSLLSLGTRINILDGIGYHPSIGMQVSLKLPNLSSSYKQPFLAPNIIAIASQKISDKFSLLLNVGIDYDGNTPKPNGLYVANLGYSISPKVNVFVENYGTFTNYAGSLQNRWDTGIAYCLNNNLQLDLYGGYGMNDLREDYFVSFGVSWRIVTQKEKMLN